MRLSITEIVFLRVAKRSAISDNSQQYQYRKINTRRYSRGNSLKKSLIFSSSSRRSYVFSILLLSETQSRSSSNTSGISPFPRLSAFRAFSISIAVFLTIFPINAPKTCGAFGGIRFQILRYESFTHSSASSRFRRIFSAIMRQRFPCFFAAAEMALSSLFMKRSIISLSSISSPPYTYTRIIFEKVTGKIKFFPFYFNTLTKIFQ